MWSNPEQFPRHIEWLLYEGCGVMVGNVDRSGPGVMERAIFDVAEVVDEHGPYMAGYYWQDVVGEGENSQQVGTDYQFGDLHAYVGKDGRVALGRVKCNSDPEFPSHFMVEVAPHGDIAIEAHDNEVGAWVRLHYSDWQLTSLHFGVTLGEWGMDVYLLGIKTDGLVAYEGDVENTVSEATETIEGEEMEDEEEWVEVEDEEGDVVELVRISGSGWEGEFVSDMGVEVAVRYAGKCLEVVVYHPDDGVYGKLIIPLLLSGGEMLFPDLEDLKRYPRDFMGRIPELLKPFQVGYEGDFGLFGGMKGALGG